MASCLVQQQVFHVDIVEILLEAGADVALKDAKGRTAGEIAATTGMDGSILAKLDTSC
jgi:ankyrin repeat protein